MHAFLTVSAMDIAKNRFRVNNAFALLLLEREGDNYPLLSHR